EVDGGRIRIEQNLVGIEAIAVAGGPIDAVGVPLRSGRLLRGNATMPDASRAVGEPLEWYSSDGRCRIIGIEQQRDGRRVIAVQREVPRVERRQPGRAEWRDG